MLQCTEEGENNTINLGAAEGELKGEKFEFIHQVGQWNTSSHSTSTCWNRCPQEDKGKTICTLPEPLSSYTFIVHEDKWYEILVKKSKLGLRKVFALLKSIAEIYGTYQSFPKPKKIRLLGPIIEILIL